MPRQITSHVDSPASVGLRLREARTAAGISQTALSFPGCSTGYISRLEAGARVPSLQVVRELAQRLGVSESWLARGEEEGEREAARATAVRDAELALRLGDADEAERLYTALREAAASDQERAVVEAGLGLVAYERDDLSDAVDCIEAALALDPDLWDVDALDVLGRARARNGDVEPAAALFRRCLREADARSDPAARLRFAVLLTEVLVDRTGFRDAALTLARVVDEVDGGDPVVLARVHWSQARLHTQRGEHALASLHSQKALDLLALAEHTQYRALAQNALGLAELEAGRPEEALGAFQSGLDLLGAQATERNRARFQLEMARALAMLGRTEEAGSLALAAAAEYRSDHPTNVGRSFAALADAFEEQRELDRALELYELAVEFLGEPPGRHGADTYGRYGALLERVGRRDDAFEAYKQGALLQGELDRVGA
jgi:tetratricopeptide (TPR) repeat protein